MKFVILLLAASLSEVLCYLPSGKENFLSGIFLRDLVSRINGKQELSNGDISYLDLTDGLPLDTRALSRDLEEEQMFPLDYDSLGDINMHPSIRDQEYLQHSSLWGNQYISGGAGDGNQILGPGIKINKQEIKTDASLPAYCNPPNPCPVGYTEEQGCLEDFENTASYSRSYQAMQDCMCDTEHMFECPTATNPLVEDPMQVARVDFSRLLQQSLKLNQGYPHKNLVAKKYHLEEKIFKMTLPECHNNDSTVLFEDESRPSTLRNVTNKNSDKVDDKDKKKVELSDLRALPKLKISVKKSERTGVPPVKEEIRSQVQSSFFKRRYF